MATDAHRIAPVPCDEKGFFVFLAKALKKNMVCPVVIKSAAKFCTFDFYSNSLKFIVSEKLYIIGITDTINGFRSTLASCEEWSQFASK